MLSNALDAAAFAALTFGAYVFGGRGAAAFVAGFGLLIVSYALSSETPARSITRVRFVRDMPTEPMPVHAPEVLTNDLVDRRNREAAGDQVEVAAAESMATTNRLMSALVAHRRR